MKFEIKKYHPHLLIKSLAKQLQVKSRTDCLEEIIDLPNKYGEGKITGFHFSDGISFIIFNCTFKQDWELHFINDFPAPLQFNFDIEGQVWHTLNFGNIRYQLNPLQGSITSCPTNSTQSIKLPGKRKILFTSLFIQREEYLEKIGCLLDKMPEKLATIFTAIKAPNPFFYQGNYSVAASECIKKITTNRHEGLVRSTYTEGKVLELLSRQVKQFKDDLLLPGKQVMLRKYDVDKIKLARDILIENLQKPPTIEKLAKKAGINQQKLKAGFKTIFDKTINQYLTEERLDLASILLLKEHSVKDVAAEVGYINQSHFAKKFKEKYGVLPKDYLKNIQHRLSATS